MVSRQVSPSYSLTSARLPIQLLTPARSRRGGAQRPHNAPTLCHFVECIQCDWGITRFLCVELIMQWLPVFQTLIFNPPRNLDVTAARKLKADEPGVSCSWKAPRASLCSYQASRRREPFYHVPPFPDELVPERRVNRFRCEPRSTDGSQCVNKVKHPRGSF